MIVQLQPQSQMMQKLLCPQQMKKTALYRNATWVVEFTRNAKRYVYNVLTKEFVCIQGVDPADRLELIRRWFLVEEEFDEFEYTTQFKRLFGLLNSCKKGISSYTIFTTTSCNARCYYCFERNRPTKVMSAQTCSQIVEFINRNYKGQTVFIRWFGGEPLMNHDAINAICAGLRSKGIAYQSSIITNGYLFSDTLLEQAVVSWKLTKAQITLDGTESNYNTIKNYIHPDVNPFLTVLKNIGKLVDRGIKVIIRLNLSLKNVDDLCQLVAQVHKRFGENNLLRITVCALFDLRNEDNERILERGLTRIQDMLFEYNLGVLYECFSKNRVNHCQFDDDGHSIVVFPDGNIGWCEHALGGPYVGSVAMLNRSEESLPKCHYEYVVFDKCRKCALYPDCLKLSNCDTNNTCYEFDANYEIQQIKDTMRKVIIHHEA